MRATRRMRRLRWTRMRYVTFTLGGGTLRVRGLLRVHKRVSVRVIDGTIAQDLVIVPDSPFLMDAAGNLIVAAG